MFRVGIDIGGTFTDMLLIGEDGAAVIGKTLTTPGDPSLAVEEALRPALETGVMKTQGAALTAADASFRQRVDDAALRILRAKQAWALLPC